MAVQSKQLCYIMLYNLHYLIRFIRFVNYLRLIHFSFTNSWDQYFSNKIEINNFVSKNN